MRITHFVFAILLIGCTDRKPPISNSHNRPDSIELEINIFDKIDDFHLISHKFIIPSGSSQTCQAGRFLLTAHPTLNGEKMITIQIDLFDEKKNSKIIDSLPVTIIEGRKTTQDVADLQIDFLGLPAKDISETKAANQNTLVSGEYILNRAANGGEGYTFEQGGEFVCKTFSDASPTDSYTGRYFQDGSNIRLRFDDSNKAERLLHYWIDHDGVPTLGMGGSFYIHQSAEQGAAANP